MAFLLLSLIGGHDTAPVMSFLQDFRYAARTLQRTPALSLVIVASLAIGIGAYTAIFSVVNALLKPLPYPDPDRLAVLWLRRAS
jgi:hypothetical protein